MKDSYWFKHDSNARNDEKIIDLRSEMGYEGYGIYWALIEFLRDNSNYEAEYKPKRLSMALTAEESKIQEVITKYGLFVYDENGKFYSQSLKNRMVELDRKREQQTIKANKRWAKEKQENDEDSSDDRDDAMAMPRQCNSNAIREEKNIEEQNTEDKIIEEEKRGCKERKGEEIFLLNLPSVPDKKMIEYLCEKHGIQNNVKFIYSFFFVIDRIQKTALKEVELLNFITKGFDKLLSEKKVEDLDKKVVFHCIHKYGFGLDEKISNRLTEKILNQKINDESEELALLFDEALKHGQASQILKNVVF